MRRKRREGEITGAGKVPASNCFFTRGGKKLHASSDGGAPRGGSRKRCFSGCGCFGGSARQTQHDGTDRSNKRPNPNKRPNHCWTQHNQRCLVEEWLLMIFLPLSVGCPGYE